MPKKPALGVLKEFRLKKSDGIRIHLELFKNSAAVCFSGKIPTGEVESYLVPNKESAICAPYFFHFLFGMFQLFLLAYYFLLALDLFLSLYILIGSLLNCVKKNPCLFLELLYVISVQFSTFLHHLYIFISQLYNSLLCLDGLFLLIKTSLARSLLT